MYKILRPIKANTNLATEPKFNAQDIYDFLLSIEELKNRKSKLKKLMATPMNSLLETMFIPCRMIKTLLKA